MLGSDEQTHICSTISIQKETPKAKGRKTLKENQGEKGLDRLTSIYQ